MLVSRALASPRWALTVAGRVKHAWSRYAILRTGYPFDIGHDDEVVSTAAFTGCKVAGRVPTVGRRSGVRRRYAPAR